jgi:hypothetical protein
MSEQLTPQDLQSQQDFTWDEIKNELDYAKEHSLEADAGDFIANLAGNIDAIHSGGTTIPGTDEWIPGKVTYSYKRTDTEGNVRSEPLSEDLALGIRQFAKTWRATKAANESNNGQLPAPELGSMLVKGSATESGRHIYREDNGRFMSKEKVALLSAGHVVDALPAPSGLAVPFGSTPQSVELPLPTGSPLSSELPMPLGQTASSYEIPIASIPDAAPASAEPLPTIIVNDEPGATSLDSLANNTDVANEWAAPSAADAVLLNRDNPASPEYVNQKKSLKQRALERMAGVSARLLSPEPLFGRGENREPMTKREKLAWIAGAASVAAVGIWIAKETKTFDGLPFIGNKVNSASSLADAADTLGANGANKVATAAEQAGNLAEAADMLDGSVDAPRGTGVAAVAEVSLPPASTFTVTEAWQPGSPTAWSWAQSQGIPESNVPGFLSEVMGADWQEQARQMQIGDSLSATAEQIAKYKS